MESLNVLITGGTGMIGRYVRDIFNEKSHMTAVLTRQRNLKSINSFHWDPDTGMIDPEAIEFADVIIHLAGENISAGRWTTSRKRSIRESRVKPGTVLSDAIARAKRKPAKVISASAVGYYGLHTSDHIYKEQDPPGKGFLPEVTVDWENSLSSLQDSPTVLYQLRIGVVLTPAGGALPRIWAPAKMGLGAALGTGRQWVPWISLEDLGSMILFLAEGQIPGGVYNAVSPGHINNRELMQTLARHFKRPFLLPNVPSLALKLAFGEMASVVLEGSRVSSEAITSQGFRFRHPGFDDFLRALP